jgi:DNA-binding SARP family transcriptional activator
MLSQFDADWVLDARDEHRNRLSAAYAALAAAAEADGHVPAARDWAAKRAAGMPLDEHAARELIRLLVAEDDQAGAVATYQRLAARLGAELGISPAAETARLVAASREGPPAPALAAAPIAGAGNAAARLIGRDGEVRALLRHWRASRAGSGTAVAISGDGGKSLTRRRPMAP